MALGDYLTGNEWDACFYASFGKSAAGNFGDSMHKTIDKLLESGYRFSGLDENGNKLTQVENGINAPKIMLFMGMPEGIDVLGIIKNGRDFLKEHCPDLVAETDEEFEIAIADAN